MMRNASLAILFFLALPVFGVEAWAQDGVLQERACPNTPENTRAFFAQNSAAKDRTDLLALSAEIAKNGSSVCILALVDPTDINYSRKLAIRRAIWARDLLESKGVKRSDISYELRIVPMDVKFADLPKLSIVTDQ